MFRSRSWFGGGWSKPKNRCSLEHLKYLHNILERNQTVSESNRSLLVESLRCIAEILIWGDQNDSSVFDFFLEKNMLSYFLQIMRQKSGGSSFVCVQLLQTLNILFENIRNETSLYYLLSNNHVNSIIVHKFDFSDEDVMGYYVLFLKTLSLKLNAHTIHFFYNEHTNDFPLYTEAIKFFNHPESMVRIAVRTITLNVYKVDNSSMLQFIRDKTAAPYFSNLVWFIGKHILELDACVRNDTDHQSQDRLSNLVAEHLDHLHYLNDILCLDIADMNAVLTEHLLHKLFVPLYIFSLTPAPPARLSMALVTQNLAAVLNKRVDIDVHQLNQELNNPRVSCVVALFLLSLVFLVVTHAPLVHALAWVILNADHTVFKEGAAEVLNAYVVVRREAVALGFGQPHESLEESLEISASTSTASASASADSTPAPRYRRDGDNDDVNDDDVGGAAGGVAAAEQGPDDDKEHVNITDEQKQKLKRNSYTEQQQAGGSGSTAVPPAGDADGGGSSATCHPFLDMVLASMDCVENDYMALLSLCLLYAMANNKGVNAEWLDQMLNGKQSSNSNSSVYKSVIIDKLLQIINMSCQPTARIRLVTLELSIKLFCQLIRIDSADCCLLDAHHNAAFGARNQSMQALRVFYKSEDIFLDLFEDEYQKMLAGALNVEFLCMDSAVLLPPTGTPLTGIEFTRRLPCGEVEKARRAIRVFFLLRRLCQTVTYERETMLPLTQASSCVQVDNVLDLNNSDLIACTVVLKDGTKSRRFLVIDVLQLILVEPVINRLGWGLVKLVGFLQDVEVVGDKDDSRCLHITVHRGGQATTFATSTSFASAAASKIRAPILSAKFVFADHIRCMAAKQRLTKGRSKARQKKMYQIAHLLEIPGGQLTDAVSAAASMYANATAASASGSPSSGGGASSSAVVGSARPSSIAARVQREHRPLFSTAAQRAPGVASALRRDHTPSAGVSRMQMLANRSAAGGSTETGTTGYDRYAAVGSLATAIPPSTGDGGSKSRDPSRNRSSRESSPRGPRPRSEEIPLEDFRLNSRTGSPASTPPLALTPSRAHTPSRLAVHVEHLSLAQQHQQSPQLLPIVPTSAPCNTPSMVSPASGGTSNTASASTSATTTPRHSVDSSTASSTSGGGPASPGGSSITSSATVTLDSPNGDAGGGDVTVSKETSFIRSADRRRGGGGGGSGGGSGGLVETV